VRSQHWLSPLRVRIPREDDITMPDCGLYESTLQIPEADVDPVRRFTHPELEVSGDLVVPASPGMQLATNISQFFDQGRLDVHVHIFAFLSEGKLPIFDFSLYFRQCPHNLLAFSGREKADSREHVGMGYRPLDVMLEEPSIEGDRLRKCFDSTVSFAAETATPGLACHGSYSQGAWVSCISLWHSVTQSRHTASVLSIQRRTGELGKGCS
jgi:hypothetical protein